MKEIVLAFLFTLFAGFQSVSFAIFGETPIAHTKPDAVAKTAPAALETVRPAQHSNLIKVPRSRLRAIEPLLAPRLGNENDYTFHFSRSTSPIKISAPIKKAVAKKVSGAPATTSIEVQIAEPDVPLQEVPPPQAPSPAPSPPTRKDDPPLAIDMATLIEQAIVERTNTERAAEGRQLLSSDHMLANVARLHSNDMIAGAYFSHEDKNGCNSSCRASDAGYAWRAIGENIYMMSGYSVSADEAADSIVKGWMKSPGHRANILREDYTHIGVGVSVLGNHIYTTAVYAKPR